MILRSKTCCNTALYNGPLAASVLRERDSNFKMYFLPDSAFVTLSISTLSELFPPGFGISDEQGLFYYLLKNNIDELFSSSVPQIVLSAVDFHPEKADSDYWLLSFFFLAICLNGNVADFPLGLNNVFSPTAMKLVGGNAVITVAVADCCCLIKQRSGHFTIRATLG